ncbi:hypothetical protein E9993_20020 [Labilibacter sediminis]|nr:hypothetical protein E9993_20020 [Labilibacter sediminis]
MSTVIKCKVDGITDPLELQGGLSFGYDSSANVSNPTKKISFGPVNVSPFSFTIVEPTSDSMKALITWLVNHEIKEKVVFEIKDQELEAKSRDITLEKVCLESYNESISEYGYQISLSVIGQKVTVDAVPVDQTEQR